MDRSTGHCQEEEVAVIVHSMGVWLSQTMTWLYTQICSLPADVHSYVVSDESSNLDQFPFANLTSADRDRKIWTKAAEFSWQVARRRQRWLLQSVVNRAAPQVLHSHFGDRAWANIEFAGKNCLKHVVSFYGYDASRLPHEDAVWLSRYENLFDSADLFLTEGPYLARTLEKLGCPSEKIRVHHLGVPVDDIVFSRRTWNGQDPLKVLIAGSFLEKKGIPYAIQALGRIRDSVKLELTIIGDSNGQERSDREKRKILEVLNDVGLADRARLHGYRPHAFLMSEAYRNHIFLSPSVVASDGDSEGGAPVTLIEMAASGIPIVSSKHCDIPNVLIDGESGLLAEERNVDDIASKLALLLDDPELWIKLSANARDRVERAFDSRKLAFDLRAHYRSLLADNVRIPETHGY